MPERDVDHELEILVRDLGMTQAEAYETLGLTSGEDPLVSSQSDPNGLGNSALQLAEMFPHIPFPTIERIYEAAGEDMDKASEQLLSWEALNEEEVVDEDTAKRARRNKLSKQNRKIQKKLQREVSNEENDILVLSTALNVPMEEARELYWTHESDITAALLSKAPVQPLVTRGGPTSQKQLATVESNPYQDLPRYELKKLIGQTKLRIQTLRTKTRSAPNDVLARTRAQQAAADLHHWKSELRLLELALTKSEVMQSSGVLTGNNKLDLHGRTLEEAKLIVSEAVDLVKRGLSSQLVLVTGAGKHSLGGPVLKTWVRNYLKQQNVSSHELEGSFIVSTRLRI